MPVPVAVVAFEEVRDVPVRCHRRRRGVAARCRSQCRCERAGHACRPAPKRRGPDPAGGGDQQPEGELGPGRLRQERVHVGLLDRVRRVVRLRLDRPQASLVVLGDEVDPGIGTPPAGPVRPPPHPPQQVPVERVVAEIPRNDPLPLVAPTTGIRIKPPEKSAEVPHRPERLRGRRPAPPVFGNGPSYGQAQARHSPTDPQPVNVGRAAVVVGGGDGVVVAGAAVPPAAGTSTGRGCQAGAMSSAPSKVRRVWSEPSARIT